MNQDYVKHEELYIPTEVMDTMPDDNWFNSISSGANLSKKERMIVRLFALGLTRADVRYVLDMSQNSLDVAIHRLRKKAKDM